MKTVYKVYTYLLTYKSVPIITIAEQIYFLHMNSI